MERPSSRAAQRATDLTIVSATPDQLRGPSHPLGMTDCDSGNYNRTLSTAFAAIQPR